MSKASIEKIRLGAVRLLREAGKSHDGSATTKDWDSYRYMPREQVHSWVPVMPLTPPRVILNDLPDRLSPEVECDLAIMADQITRGQGAW